MPLNYSSKIFKYNLHIAISYTEKNLKVPAASLALRLNLPLVEINNENYDYLLVVTDIHIELRSLKEKLSPIYIDFVHGKNAYRSFYASRRNELIARAVGIKPRKKLKILDVTAGLGRDAFLLACLGCEVVMIERSPIMAILLEDGLHRAKQMPDFKEISIELVAKDAREYLMGLSAIQIPQVIYLDPMFPENKKTALVKKEMRVLRDIVGEDADAAELLKISLNVASERVVVKRHRLAPIIPGPKPDIEFKGQSSRFDVYLRS